VLRHIQKTDVLHSSILRSVGSCPGDLAILAVDERIERCSFYKLNFNVVSQHLWELPLLRMYIRYIDLEIYSCFSEGWAPTKSWSSDVPAKSPCGNHLAIQTSRKSEYIPKEIWSRLRESAQDPVWLDVLEGGSLETRSYLTTKKKSRIWLAEGWQDPTGGK